MQRIGLGLLLINILAILIIQWKPTRDNLQEVASWKKVASPLADRVVSQNGLICWRNELKLGKQYSVDAKALCD